MEYIQCTHCDKRYAANDKARAAVGKFTTCRNCKGEFLVVILDTEARGEDQNITISSESWDPAKTMAELTDNSIVDLSQTIKEDDDDEETHARQALAALRKDKRNKNLKLLAVLVVLLFVVGGYTLMQEESRPIVSTANLAPIERVLSNEALDANSAACRTAAAQKWIIDHTVMHADYSAEQFIDLLKDSQRQTEKINAACKNKQLIDQLIDAATADKVPSWLATDIAILRD